MKKEVETDIMIPEKLPNINLMKDSMFMITDRENYNSDNSTAFGERNSRCRERVESRTPDRQKLSKNMW